MAIHEAKGKTDEWYTPKYIFDALDCVFDMDVCSPVSLEYIKTPTDTFLTSRSLDREWKGFVWMNPPFGGRNGLTPWLNKISSHGNGIALTPDRSSAPWWQKAALECDAMMLVSGKVKFVKPDGSTGDQPGNGTTLFAYGENAVTALENAQRNKLGIAFIKLKSA